MYKLPTILIAVAVLASFGVSNAHASTWDANPFENLYPKNGVNTSYSLDWNKHQEVKQNQKGWATSKVCGLSLCTDLPATLAKSSTGNVYIKGYFP